MLTRIWLTYKQHRFETLALVIVCLGLTAAALIEAFRLNSLNVPLHCLQTWQGGYIDPSQGPVDAATLRCNELARSFYDMKQGADMSLVQLLLLLTPMLAGIVYGAPLVAREIEQGTAPLSWALSGSRRRWLLGKVLAGLLLIVPLMLAVGLAANVFEGAQNPGPNPYASFDNYLGRGVIDVFWALAAFAGTFALGTILGRTLPALILALVVCVFVRGAWEAGVAHTILTPLAVEQQFSDSANGFNMYTVDLQLYMKTYIDGKEVGNDELNVWYQRNMVCIPMTPPPSDASSPGASTSPGATGTPGASSSPSPMATPDMSKGGGYAIECGGPPNIDPSHMPQYVQYVLPGSWYWQITALQSGLLLLGSIFCGGIALVWVDRRRPY